MTDDAPRPSTDYRWTRPFPTRWHDNDVFGHVNNTIYYAAMDTTVTSWLLGPGGHALVDDEATPPSSSRPPAATSPPARSPTRSSSGCAPTGSAPRACRWGLGIFRESDGELLATGTFVHVFVDRETRRPIPVPGRDPRPHRAPTRSPAPARTDVEKEPDERRRSRPAPATRPSRSPRSSPTSARRCPDKTALIWAGQTGPRGPRHLRRPVGARRSGRRRAARPRRRRGRPGGDDGAERARLRPRLLRGPRARRGRRADPPPVQEGRDRARAEGQRREARRHRRAPSLGEALPAAAGLGLDALSVLLPEAAKDLVPIPRLEDLVAAGADADRRATWR